jgi:hypothetical protein
MNFNIVFCKNRKKFDKYVKLNRVRNKVIIDIKEIKREENIVLPKNKDYFNLMIYTKISHAMQKGKSVYYLPDFTDKNINVKQVYSVKNVFNEFDFNFNAILFYKEFLDDNNIKEDIFDNLHLFDNSQLIEDY